METMHAAGRRSLPPVPRPRGHEDTRQDAAQRFVARLRAAAAEFAVAAGAESAVVREAVPPARHRRSRCRLVLRYADGAESDLTFVGPPGRPAHTMFAAAIGRWLRTGQRRRAEWLVADPDAPGGLAVDVAAWLTDGSARQQGETLGVNSPPLRS
jgi:hypothetical protein